jgi:serine kinase of HPr protein (carbohydrate metabolism regulator)
MTPSSTILHGTAIAIGRHGVLLLGPSGSGKSDLALRLIDDGARLVADDQTVLALKGERLMASAPAVLLRRIEVRGLGVVTLPAPKVTQHVPLSLLVDLVPPSDVERLPEPERREILGVSLPLLQLVAFEVSAPAKLRLALASLPTR